jgi:hypothetical protein
LIAPLALIALGLYGLSFPFDGPEDVTHTLFSALAIGGGLYEAWRRSTEGWMWISRGILVVAAGFLLFHRHSHHQPLFVTLHHSLFAMILLVLASLYDIERARGWTVTTAGLLLMVYFID